MLVLADFLWWIVLGVLLGWLASWLVGRGPRRTVAVSIGRAVETPVDNPEHVRQIAALEQEVSELHALRERADAAMATEAGPPSTELQERLAAAEETLAAARRRASELEVQVLQLQPPPIDPEAARAAGFALQGPDDLAVVHGIDARIGAVLNRAGIHSLHDLARSAPARLRAILSEAGPDFRVVDPETWPEQAELAAHNHWRGLKSLHGVLGAGAREDAERERTRLASEVRVLRSQLAEREAEIAQLSATPTLDHAAARAAGFTLERDDDLHVIEGIGPAIVDVLRGAGIASFASLAHLTPAQIKSVLERGGPNFRLVNPQTWSDQALLAANNRWSALATLRTALAATRRM